MGAEERLVRVGRPCGLAVRGPVGGTGAGRAVGLAVGVTRPGGATAAEGDEARDDGGRDQVLGRLVARGVGSSLGVPR